ncbi:MAG: alpha/beta hydrolase [Chloroflexia bacterium]|nr:alpha/beta hydrolase [Chloroflexia bacterium]
MLDRSVAVLVAPREEHTLLSPGRSVVNQPPANRSTRRTLLQAASASALAVAGGAGAAPSLHAQGTSQVNHPQAMSQGAPMSQATPTAEAPLTVVLVHGAFADASGWAGIIERLQAAGIAVMAPANPLRSVSGDAAYIASVVSQIPGPVLLVGHSYGGMVISNAAPMADNVVGLVYVCAFIPEEGESIQALSEQATDSLLGPALVPRQYPNGPGEEPGVELYIDPAQFHDVFAADLSAEQAAVMAVSQRPGGAIGFGEPSGPVGWKTLPSWAIISPNDVTIGPSGEKFMAERSGAAITELDGSHVLFIAQPDAVTEVIMTAIEGVSN